MAELVTYNRTDHVSTISMDDGKVNVFSIPMLRALHEAFDEAERDGTVVLLTGRPGCFSAGFDLQVLRWPARGRRDLAQARCHPRRSASSRSLRRWPSPAQVTPSPLAPFSSWQRTRGLERTALSNWG